MSEGGFVVWWWPVGLAEQEFDVPVPYERRFPTLSFALNFARAISLPGNEWVKVFASGDETDVRYRWERP